MLGVAAFALAAAAIVEKYRTVRGAVLLPARVLECRRASSTSNNRSAGGYRYLVVELHANGQRLELETNDAFWFKHDKDQWARQSRSGTTPTPAVSSAKAGRRRSSAAGAGRHRCGAAADPVRAQHGMDIICSVGAGRGGDILLAVILAKVLHKNNETQQKIDTADDFVRAMTLVLQSETDLLAEQLRAMQGERPHHQRHTAGFLRRSGREPAPECGHQYRTAGGYRPSRGCPPEGRQRRPAGPTDDDGNAVEKP